MEKTNEVLDETNTSQKDFKEVEILNKEDLDSIQETALIEIDNSTELSTLSKTININDVDTILTFGKTTADKIGGFSDKILNEMQMSKLEDSGKLMGNLNVIMKEFDANDFDNEPKNFISKIFYNAKESIEKLFAKYNTMGSKIGNIYTELKVYENEINTTNDNLDALFQNSMDYFKDLQIHISAGNIAINNLKNNEIVELEKKAQETGDEMDAIKLNNAREALNMISQRIYDLELAKAVALQTLPQIKLIQKGNYDLVRKINSAFIVTLPIFKQGIIQAIALKRQKIQSEAMAELDKKTNELILKNAINTAEQSKLTAELSSGSAIKLETLQESWAVIMKGIEETKLIQNSAAQKREEGTKMLHQIQTQYQNEVKKIK